jgi:hypothetical protein
MAVPNMIVTLAMNASKYGDGLKKAARQTTSFGQFTAKAFSIARGAFLALTVAALRMVPVLANMGAESRKADIQLRFMLENMQGVGAATDATVKRMAEYADQVNRATGVDDEQVKAVQRKLLVFKTLRKTADELGGTFDRTTAAAIDLAAAGFGDMEANAIKLGRVLQDPTRNLNALSRAGITFTEAEKRKIKALQESGKLLEAQDMILLSVENRVKGIAEASATPFEKLNAQFQQIGDAIGEAMLPALESMNIEVSKWLATPQGQKDVKAIADAFVAMSLAIKDVVLFLKQVFDLFDAISKFNMDWVGALRGARDFLIGGAPAPTTGGNTSAPGGARGRANSAPVINFNAPIDSVSAGREVARVLADYNRANGAR